MKAKVEVNTRMFYRYVRGYLVPKTRILGATIYYD